MTDESFDPGVTALLKKHDPVWWRIRETVTMRVAVVLLFGILSTAITAIVQFNHLRSDFTDMKDTLKGDQERAAADAALHQHVEDLDDRLSKIESLRDYQQGVVNEPNTPRRKRQK